jgi:hypothetical protein
MARRLEENVSMCARHPPFDSPCRTPSAQVFCGLGDRRGRQGCFAGLVIATGGRCVLRVGHFWTPGATCGLCFVADKFLRSSHLNRVASIEFDGSDNALFAANQPFICHGAVIRQSPSGQQETYLAVTYLCRVARTAPLPA